ncbi:helix-turn-helix domain-containing protein, partial [Candidatus Fukatsuia symbiotica]
MSMKLMTHAMSIKVGNPLRKLILLKLADNANDQGECWPSVPYIAHQCEMTDRSVQKHLHQLAVDGLLWIEYRKNEQGVNKSNVYHLTLNNAPKVKGENKSPGEDTGSPPGESRTLGGVSGTRGSASGTPGRGESGTPRISHSFEPVIEPVIEPNTPTASKICAIKVDECPAKREDPIPHPDCFPAQRNSPHVDTQTSLASRYAFEGKIIRLTPQDFDSWQTLFPHLDLVYELTRLDLEFRHDTPKSWFCTASQKLNYQNKRAVDGTTFKRVSGDRFAKKDYG